MTETVNDIQTYIDNGLFHSVHTSERKAFRACRRRWSWSYREGYHPTVTPKPLEFGIAYHTAMEMWYEPQSWLDDRQVQSQLAIEAFRQVCKDQLSNYERLNGTPDDKVLADYTERVDLGVNMVRYYTQRVSPKLDVGMTPLAVEIPFEAPMPLRCKCDACYHKWGRSELGIKHHDSWQDGLTQKQQYLGATSTNEGFDFYKYQVWEGLPVTFGGRIDAIFQDQDGRILVVDWKAQPLDEIVLTPNGWVDMGSLKVGDQVIGSNGKPTKVTGVFPQGKKKVYKVKTSDGSYTEATSDHLWTIYAKSYDSKKVMTTKDIVKELKKDRPNYIKLPELKPIEFSETNEILPIDPYAVGLLIGDGGFTGGSIRFSNSDGLQQYLPFECKLVTVGLSDYRVIGAIPNIKELGLYGHKSVDKFIPNVYKYSTPDNRLRLIQGLMDTDGYVSKGNAIFCTSSNKLRDDFVELVRSLGGKAIVFNDGLRHNATTESYQISVKLPKGMCPFFANIKHKKGRWRRGVQTHQKLINSIEYSRETDVQCISVDAKDNLYITRDYILTHNTTARILDDYDESAFLELDDQVGGYPVALFKLGSRVDGFIYHEQKKAVPGAPKRLSRAYKNKLFSTAKDEPVEYETFVNTVMEEDLRAYNMGFYDEYLEYLQGPMKPKFFQRHTIYKTETQMNNFWNYLIAEAQDMLNNPRVYPQASRFSCNSCLYRQPCEGQNRGEDYKYTLNSLYVRS